MPLAEAAVADGRVPAEGMAGLQQALASLRAARSGTPGQRAAEHPTETETETRRQAE